MPRPRLQQSKIIICNVEVYCSLQSETRRGCRLRGSQSEPRRGSRLCRRGAQMIQNNLIWIQGRSTKEKRSFLVYDRKNDPTAAAALEIQGRPRGAQKFQSLSVGPLGQYLFASVEPFWSSGRANLSRSEKSIFEAKMARGYL